MNDKSRQLKGLGRLIFLARTKSERTQAALAREAGTTPNTVARIERGEQEPGALLLAAIARALGVTVDELLPRP